jgi:methyl-accepting chemotaxis protein
MIDTLMNTFGVSSTIKELKAEVAEFHAIKTEIDKARCVIEMNSEGSITSINQNLVDALGYEANEVVNQHHRTLVGRAIAGSDTYIQFWAGLNSLKTQSGEFKLIHKNGDDVWFQGYYAAVPNDTGKLSKIVAYLTDISGNHKDLHSSKNALAQMKGALNGSSQAVMAIDRDFVVTYVNEATKQLFTDYAAQFRQAFPNFDPSKILGTNIDVFHRNPQHQRTLLADSKNLPFTTIIKLADLSIRLHVTASYDAAGEYIGNVLEWRNVTKEMSDAGELAAISRSMATIAFDPQGNILDVNDNFATVTGYDKKDILGKNHSMFTEPSYANSADYKAFWDKLTRGEEHSGQFKRIGKGGKEIWLEATYNPILDEKGKPFKVVKYARDITKHVEKEKENAIKSAEALAIKNTLDSASINVMMADNDGVIRYMNPSTEKLMQSSSSEFRKVLPQFDPNKIVGQNFDIFHKNPSHQRNLLANLKGSHVTTLPVGGLWFKLSASPIYKDDGSRLGTVLEWMDVTAERKVEADISNIVEGASNGDLSNRLSTEGQPESTAKILEGINVLLDKFTDIIEQVKEAGETINTAAGEIATGNNDLSSRTEEQASSLEETASSMEELASTVKQNAENALQANQLATAASGVAVKGGQVVGKVVNTMSAINESAQKIEDIISVIDGIAFQTNILALNAAVEAARAGEQGRGFAVVAGEVRNLAQRSASAAKEIKDLITDSVSKTSEGTKLVEDAGQTMQEIVDSVQRVTDIMGEISAASTEQSTGIDQVNTAITSMDEVTQQNAALVEEAAAAAESLVEQANSLMETVGSFKVKGMQRQERRAGNSPMRSSAKPAMSRPVTKSTPKQAEQKIVAKTGTDDGDWEEF